MGNGELVLEYRRLDEIKMPLRNPKGHDLGEISESIGRFGYKAPMMVNGGTGRLVAGQGRWEALVGLKRSGRYGKVPGGIKVAEDGMWEVPVIVTEFESEVEAEAYLLADNRLTELGGMEDEKQLLEMLVDLQAEGEELLLGIGYDGDDIDALFDRINGEETKGSAKERVAEKELSVEELLAKWKVEEGSCWGNKEKGIAIFCGDCRDESSWRVGLSSIGVEKLGLMGIMTSPPYALQRKKQYGGVEEREYVDWWEGVQSRAYEWLSVEGSFFLNIKANVKDGERQLYVMDLVCKMKREWGWAFVDQFCWLRPPLPKEVTRRFKNGFEDVYQFSKEAQSFKFRPESIMIPSKSVPKLKFEGGKMGSDITQYQGRDGWILGDQEYSEGMAYPSNVIKAWVNDKVRGQEAAFPAELPEIFIKAYSDEGDAWCDPFVGSGSTLVACLRNNRKGLGIEVKPEYVAIALERLSVEEEVEMKKLS